MILSLIFRMVSDFLCFQIFPGITSRFKLHRNLGMVCL
jgi:hypothetical protein